MTGQSLRFYLLPLAGGIKAVFNSSGLWFYRHSDWLGSSRLGLDTSGNLYSGKAFAPFGETYAEAGLADRSFTGQTQDVVRGQTGIYDFLFRQHSAAQGRWLVPDPVGLAAADPTNPQTWNRYAYVGNNPLSQIDAKGLWSTNIHNDILTTAFPGLSGTSAMDILQSASAYVDRWDNQGPSGSNEPGMCAPGHDLGDCDISISNIITNGVNAAGTAFADGAENVGYWRLGEAIHTFTDLTSPCHSAANGTPLCWGCWTSESIGHFLGEDIVGAILGDHLYGRQTAQAVLNAQAAYATANPGGYRAATSGVLGATSGLAYTGLVLATGSVNHSQVLQNEVSGCLLGNPAACPDGGEAIFQGLMGFEGIGAGGFPNQFFPRHIK